MLCITVSLIFTSSPVPSAPKRPTPSGRDVMLTSRTFTDFVKKLNVSSFFV